ncbi:MAG: peptidoglycan DD-metalloendopeptidase family protein [Candidatus Gottesmanbacteria bacterium]
MNQYQKFLKNTLLRGLIELQKNPSLKTVNEIPFSSFDILVRSFRSGLKDVYELKLKHNLRDLKYLNEVMGRVNGFLLPEVSETILAVNLPNIRQLLIAYDEAQKGRSIILKESLSHLPSFAQQVKKYNRQVIYNLTLQLNEEFPQAAKKNPEEIVKVAKDLGSTFQGQVMNGYKSPFATQDAYEVQSQIREVTKPTLVHYVERLNQVEGTSKIGTPAAIEDLANKISLKHLSDLQAGRNTQLLATAIVQNAVNDYLPVEIQLPEITATVADSVVRNLSESIIPVTNREQAIEQAMEDSLASSEVKTVIKQKGFDYETVLPPEQIQEIADSFIKQPGVENLADILPEVYVQKAQVQPITELPIEQVRASIETTIRLNIPPKLAENSELITALTTNIEQKIKIPASESEEDYTQALGENIQESLAKPAIAKTITAAGVTSEQVVKMGESIAKDISPVVYQEIVPQGETPQLSKTTTLPSIDDVGNLLKTTFLISIPITDPKEASQIADAFTTLALERLLLPSLTRQTTLDGQIRNVTLEEYQKGLVREFKNNLSSPLIQKQLIEAGISTSPKDLPIIATKIAATVSSAAYSFALSPTATMIGGRVGGVTPTISPVGTSLLSTATTAASVVEVTNLLKSSIVDNLSIKDPRAASQIAETFTNIAMGRIASPGFTKQFTADGKIRNVTITEYEKSLVEEFKNELTNPWLQKQLIEAGVSISPSALPTIATKIAATISPTAYSFALSPAATMIGGTMPAMTTPRAPVVIPSPTISHGLAKPTTGSGFLNEFGNAWQATQPTDFLFFGLSTPTWKTIPSGLMGLSMDAIGIVPPIQSSMLWGYLMHDRSSLLGNIRYFENKATEHKIKRDAKGETAYNNMAEYLKGIVSIKDKTPKSLMPFVQLGEFYGKLQSFNTNLFGLAGVTPFQLLKLTGDYGGPGFSYGTELMAKTVTTRLLGAGLHATLPKLFPYDELAREVYFKYGPKGIIKGAKKFLFNKLGTRVTALLAKLGLSTVGTALSGGTLVLAQAAWYVFKKIWKVIGGAIALGLFWIYSTFGPGAFFAALSGGMISGAIGFVIFGFWGGIFSFIGGAIGSALAHVLLKGALSSVGSSIASTTSGILHGLTSLTGSITSYALPVSVGAGAAVVIPTAFYFMVISSAFEIPGQPSPSQSKYFQVAKEVQFSGKLGDPINYALTITAGRNRLTNIRITDTTDFNCRGSAPSVAVRNFAGVIPKEIATNSALPIYYQVPTDNKFNDCLITNTAEITVDVPDLKIGGEKSFVLATLSIGNPPIVAPRGMPIRDNPQRGSGYTYNQITGDGSAHNGIDVHGPVGATVYSTFASDSRVIDVGYNGKSGNYIWLSAGKYRIFMGHLRQRPALDTGDIVGPLAAVGIQGTTGNSDGEHVHYMIWDNGTIVDPRGYGVPSPPW